MKPEITSNEPQLIRTCATCPNVKIHQVMNNCFWSCKLSGSVIPHSSETEGNVVSVTFTRIPLGCMREEGVIKSENPAAKKFHEKDKIKLQRFQI